MDLVTLDFETYFDAKYSLRNQKMNMSEYIRDDRFRAHMCGIKINTEPTFVVGYEDIPKALKSIRWKKTKLLAHNTAFDGLILQHHYNVVPAVYRDTLCMARALHSNEIGASLDEVAKLYGVGNKLPDVLDQTKGVLDLRAIPGLYDAASAYCATDVDLCWAIYQMMLAKKFPDVELELIHLTLKCFCDPQLRIDRPRADKVHKEEIARKTAILMDLTGADTLEAAKKLVGKDEWLADKLREAGVEPPVKVSEKKSLNAGHTVYNYAFAKSDESFLEILDTDNEVAQTLVEARLEVKSALNETRALRLLNASAKPNWRLPVGYNYYGAHTGRWSGANKMNMQNFQRKGELRKCILAPEGYHVVTGDSAQIEARVLACLAGNEPLLQVFRNKECPYCYQATEMFGHEVVKGRSEADEDDRQIGKVALLALGFAGAEGAFNSMAKVYGVKLPGPQVRMIVRRFRASNPSYVRFWDDCTRALDDLCRGKSGTLGVGIKLRYEVRDKVPCIVLPNGMCLKYPGLRKEVNPDTGYEEFTYQKKKYRTKIYSGSLTENIVQALARIIVAEQMIVVSHKYRLVMMTHDEGSWLVRAFLAASAAKQIEHTMSVPPTWAPSLPVGSEVKHAPYYCK